MGIKRIVQSKHRLIGKLVTLGGLGGREAVDVVVDVGGAVGDVGVVAMCAVGVEVGEVIDGCSEREDAAVGYGDSGEDVALCGKPYMVADGNFSLGSGG